MAESSVITTDLPAAMAKLQAAIKLRTDRLFPGRTPQTKADFIHECGLFWRELINLAWPSDPAKTKQRISGNVNRSFHEMSDAEAGSGAFGPSKQGHGAVRWTGSSTFALYGIAKDVDYTDASVDALQQLFYARGSGQRTGGRAKYPHGHGKQTVYIWQKISTKKKTVRELEKRFIGHIGKQKASFVPVHQSCGSPGSPVPSWITKNVDPQKGQFHNEFETDSPFSEAISRAAGITKFAQSGRLVTAARKRTAAIIKRLVYALHSKGEALDLESE